MRQVVVAVDGFGGIALPARVDCDDAVILREVLYLGLENLSGEGQPGYENQRFSLPLFPVVELHSRQHAEILALGILFCHGPASFVSLGRSPLWT